MKRRILIPIDSIMAMLKDYCKDTGDVPMDAVPLALQIKPTEQGLFAVLAESGEWKDDTPIRVEFDIKRVYGMV